MDNVTAQTMGDEDYRDLIKLGVVKLQENNKRETQNVSAIKQFLQETPEWLKQQELQVRATGGDFYSYSTCHLCGINPHKIKKLYEELKNLNGKLPFYFD